MNVPNEDRLRALELLQREDVRLTAFDKGTLAAIRRSNPMLAARCDALERVEASRARKRAARNRKPATARQREASVFDRAADDDDRRLLP